MSFRLCQNKDGSYGVFNLSSNTFLCNIPSSRTPPEKKKVQVSPPQNKKRKAEEISKVLAPDKPPERRLRARLEPSDTGLIGTTGSAVHKSSSNGTSRGRIVNQNGRVTLKSSNRKTTPPSRSSAGSVPKKPSIDKYNFKDERPSSPEQDDECIDTNGFLRMVNLIPTERFKNSSDIRVAKEKFPIRRINRLPSQNSCTRNRIACDFTIHDLVEDLDICSPLLHSGVHIVPFHNYVMNQVSVSKAVTNYEHHCQTVEASLLTKSKGLSHQLRNRESLIKYSITYRSPKGMEKKYNHMYSFSVRQRKQRHQKLKSGLSMQSLALLKNCKKVVVKLKPLSQETIDQCMVGQLSEQCDSGELKNNGVEIKIPIPNSLRILQPVPSDDLENKELSTLRHNLLDSDVAYFFGIQNRSIGDEMRITKVHDWLNLVENCSPSKETKPKKSRHLCNSNMASKRVHSQIPKETKVTFSRTVNGANGKNKFELEVQNINQQLNGLKNCKVQLIKKVSNISV